MKTPFVIKKTAPLTFGQRIAKLAFAPITVMVKDITGK
jgi:hypothetical protein